MSLDNQRVDLNSLRLRLYAEFENWQDFVSAVDEFQKKTLIKLTITTSKKANPESGGKKRSKMIIFSDGDGDESTSEMTLKRNFEYKYLKLTCKHYGSYRSTSKGIRPNQSTTKLMCPTYIYGSYDHYKEKFIIKQMYVNCNHELKDEEVLLPKLLKDSTLQPLTSEESETSLNRKRYVKVRNRNVLKVPLESPGNLILPVPSKVKCNHEPNKYCEAMTLTAEDLSSIHCLFASSSKKDQNNLMLDWIEVIPCKNVNFDKQSKHRSETTIQISFKLPSIDGTLLRVCYKAFLQILRVSVSRVNDVIFEHYGKKRGVNGEELCEKDSREIETSIANILTSFSKEGESEESTQLIYCDTVDLPQTEDSIEDPFSRENINNILDDSLNHRMETITIPALPKASENSEHSLNYPVIKMCPVLNGFAMTLECDFEVTLKGVSIENNGKSLKIIFGTNN